MMLDQERDDDICPGCRLCECIKCGGHMGAIEPERADTDLRCIQCGHIEVT